MALPNVNGQNVTVENPNITYNTQVNNMGWSYPVPQPFQGNWKEDAVAWLEEMELHLESSFKGMSERFIPRYIGRHLEAAALDWHRAAVNGYPTYEVYRVAFLSRFDDAAFELRARNYLKTYCIESKSVARVHSDLCILFRKAKITDTKERFFTLMDKLSDNDKYELNINKKCDYEDAINYLEERERVSSAAYIRSKNPYTLGKDKAKNKSSFESNKNKNSETKYYKNNNYKNKNYKKNESENKNYKNNDYKNKYYKTNESEDKNKNYKEDYTKNSLNLLQHQNKVEETQNTARVTAITGSTEINDVKVKFTYDTGASVCYISKNLAKTLNLKESKAKQSVYCAFGTEKPASVYADIELKFRGFSTTVDIYSAEDSSEDLLLLGLSWAATYHASISWKSKRIYVKLGSEVRFLNIELENEKGNSISENSKYKLFRVELHNPTLSVELIDNNLDKEKKKNLKEIIEKNKDKTQDL
ncbi:hypothetical protein BB561_001419 [Smittium simulii]|uniref:Retrotransposon gag domain-containing protein n=1 Tax=Smittium simulii TaxID=133385 RepID=A0A2T9YUP3_9FUNG|nr:hypothetical protein BB561_001419 [Smittium simulii]